MEGRDAGVGSCVRGAVGVDNAKLRPGGGGFGAIMRGGVKFFQKNPLASGWRVRGAVIVFRYISERLFFESTDGYTVPGLFGKHVADTFALGVDAVRGNFVFLDKRILH